MGIKIGNDLTNNWENKREKVKDYLQIWKGRDFSLIRRIHIIKSLAGSQLTYCWSVLKTPPEKFSKSLKTIIFEFLWNSMVDRMKRDTIIAPYNKGGLQMLHITSQEKALKIKWISAIQRPTCVNTMYMGKMGNTKPPM